MLFVKVTNVISVTEGVSHAAGHVNGEFYQETLHVERYRW